MKTVDTQSAPASIVDEATAKAALNKARDSLANAVIAAAGAMQDLRREIVAYRPSGVITVNEIATAVGRDRNYVDSIWSTYGTTAKGKQTRVAPDVEELEKQHRSAVQLLTDVADAQRSAARMVNGMRVERDRTVAMVYASKILGPSGIADAVGVDRNHVLRIARKANITPVWRTDGTNNNQHTIHSAPVAD